MMGLVESIWRRGLREEGTFACGEDVVEIDEYCSCVECRIAWREEVGPREGCWGGV